MTNGELTVFVTITVRPDGRDDMLAALHADQRETRANEAGCKRFDLLVSEDHPDKLFLLEVYESADAFEGHKRQPHFRQFEDAVDKHSVGADILVLGAPA